MTSLLGHGPWRCHPPARLLIQPLRIAGMGLDPIRVLGTRVKGLGLRVLGFRILGFSGFRVWLRAYYLAIGEVFLHSDSFINRGTQI